MALTKDCIHIPPSKSTDRVYSSPVCHQGKFKLRRRYFERQPFVRVIKGIVGCDLSIASDWSCREANLL